MNIFVGNLNFHTTEEQLQDLFIPFGEVSSVTIVTDKFSGRSRGFAFVEMPDNVQGESAVYDLNNYVLDARLLVVNEAKPQENNNSFQTKRK